MFGLINGNIGYMSKINNMPVTLVLSLLCSILPVNIMILLAGSSSIGTFICTGVRGSSDGRGTVYAACFYVFPFCTKTGFYAVLTPVCMHFNIGAVMPMTAGLLGEAYSVVSVICGTVVWFFLSGIKENASALGSSGKMRQLHRNLQQS